MNTNALHITGVLAMLGALISWTLLKRVLPQFVRGATEGGDSTSRISFSLLAQL